MICCKTNSYCHTKIVLQLHRKRMQNSLISHAISCETKLPFFFVCNSMFVENCAEYVYKEIQRILMLYMCCMTPTP